MEKETIVTSMDDILSIIKPRNWYQEIWWWIRYGIWTKLEDIPPYIKRFWQRGCRGWGDSDVWGLDSYLSNVILETINSLKNQLHGNPCELEFEEWKKILSDIEYTFQTAIHIQEDEWWYLAPGKRTKEEMNRLLKLKKDFESSHSKYKFSKGIKYHIMTFEECKKYDKGWVLFQKYFFQLWD